MRRCYRCGWEYTVPRDPVPGYKDPMVATRKGWRCRSTGICRWRQERELSARQLPLFGGSHG